MQNKQTSCFPRPIDTGRVVLDIKKDKAISVSAFVGRGLGMSSLFIIESIRVHSYSTDILRFSSVLAVMGW